MKGLKIPLIVSLIVHLFLFSIIFLYVYPRIKQKQKHIVLILPQKTQPRKPKFPSKKINPSHSVSKTQPSEKITHAQKNLKSPTKKNQSNTPVLFNHSSWEIFIKKGEKKETFLSVRPHLSQKDSLLHERLHSWQQSFKENKSSASYHDDVADIIQKRNQGTTPLLVNPGIIVNTIKKKREKKISPHFDFIPTEAQVRTMALLYQKGKATQIDIYPLLNTKQPITAERFNRELNFLVKKGFISKKKISPENPFNIITPLGIVPVEMSSKNRHNRVYLYEPKVNRNKLMTYLQARLYLLKEKLKSTPKDSSYLKPMIKDIEKKIQLLLTTSPVSCTSPHIYQYPLKTELLGENLTLSWLCFHHKSRLLLSTP